MVQINDDYYEDLTPDSLAQILGKLKNGVEVAPGPHFDRVNSAPEGGAKSLTDAALFDGSRNTIAKLPNLPQPTTEASAEATGKPDAGAPTNAKRDEPTAGKATLIDTTSRPEASKDGMSTPKDKKD